MSNDATYITLFSNERGKSLRQKKSLLSLLPYFSGMFESSFADAQRDSYKIEHFEGMTHEHETLYFLTYLHSSDRSTWKWLRGVKGRPALKRIIPLCHLFDFYGSAGNSEISVQIDQFLKEIWYYERKHMDAAFLEEFFTTCWTIEELLGESKLPIAVSTAYAQFMRMHSDVLPIAHDMSEDIQNRF